MLKLFISKTVLAILQAVLLLLPASFSYAQLQGAFENPVDGAVESGIGVVAGWHCTAKQINIAIDGVSIGRAGSGTLRPDTESVCSHAETGFSLLYNWNNLPPGEHTVTMYADGAEFDSKVITTTQSAGAAFVRGLQKTVTVPDFPSAGRSATLEWREAKQAFVVTNVVSTQAPVVSDMSDLVGSYSQTLTVSISGTNCYAYNLASGSVSANISITRSGSILNVLSNTQYDGCSYTLSKTAGDAILGYQLTGNGRCNSGLNASVSGALRRSGNKLVGSVSAYLTGCTQTGSFR